MSHIRRIILLAGLLVFSYVAVHHFAYPLIWVSTGWAAFWGTAALLSRHRLFKAVWFNLAFGFFLVGSLETYAALSLHAKAASEPAGPRLQTIRSQDYMDPHAVLGYAPRPSSRTEVQLTFGAQTIYKVNYTFDENGLRITPPGQPSACDRCVLFFGGSFTLGEGVEDAQSLPFQVGQQSRCRVYNFGFHGYGPHQMLAAIEKGMVSDVVDCQPQAAVYQAVLDHVSRVAGLSSWGMDTPRYRISADGAVAHTGRFSDMDGPADRVRAAFKQTHFYKRFIRNRIQAARDDVDLLVAIVAAAQQKLSALYPGIAFHILLWDNPSDKKAKQKLSDWLDDGLSQKGLQIHRVSQILPGYPQERARYELNPEDKHPNARAYEELATYITQHILDAPQRRKSGD